MKYRTESAGKVYEIDVEPTAQGYVLRGPDGIARLVQLQPRPDDSQRALTPWGYVEVKSARRGAELWAAASGRRLAGRVERARSSGYGAGSAGGAGRVLSPMTGMLLRVDARVGDMVKLGQAIAVIEAMKMENELVAPLAGIVVEVAVTAPSTIEKGTLIVRLEAP
jgi:biotin carboxyl carrier protein